MLIWLLIIAGVVILDQGTKLLMIYGFGLDEAGESIPLIEDVFHFTCVRNTGAAFGMLGEENQRWIFIIISIIGIAALLVYLWKFRPESKWACAAISMVIGGGIGNMIDRCFRVGIIGGEERHYVYDFLDFCAFPDLWKWTFNVADAFVCVGAGILMVWCVYSFVQEVKIEKQKKLAANGKLDEGADEILSEECEDLKKDEADVDDIENVSEDSTKEN
ncbi:MAG: signal peptidase II [Ruminococcaceae bacterium]|nr:signal peptidase II [Oscillospiraceae bacterium]